MNLALEVDSLNEVAERIRGFLDVKSPQGFLDKVKMLPMLAEMGRFFPKVVPTGPCKEVIQRDNFSLLDFPILQCWPKDGGRFITLPCVITRDPKTGKRNVGMYRMQVYDERTTGMHWQRQKVAAEHYRDRMREAFTKSGETGALARPEGKAVPSKAGAPPFASFAKGGKAAAVDIMARSSGGAMPGRRRLAPPAAWKSPSPSAPTPHSPSPPSCPLRPTSRSTSSPDSSARSRSNW